MPVYRLSLFSVVLASCCFISACDSEGDAYKAESVMEFNGRARAPVASLAREPSNEPTYRAYEHNVSIEIEKELIGRQIQAAIEHCNNDQENRCSLISSVIDTEGFGSNIVVRIANPGIDALISIAAEGGEVINQSSYSTDLSDAFFDNQKRLEMLETYREKLLELETNAANDIEALIKISSELIKTQTELESIQGRQNVINQRIERDLLTISFNPVFEREGFFSAIIDAVSNFSSQLSYAIASIIETMAWLIPWSTVIVLLLLTGRLLWRKFIRRQRS